MSLKHCYIPTLSAITIAALSVPFISINAEARPSTRAFTCDGLLDYIDDRGAVVMNHKSSSLYRRFVAHAGYCRNEGGSTKYFIVPTKSGSCRLKICFERERLRFFDKD